MLELTQGDVLAPMRAVFRKEGVPLDVSTGVTLSGWLIYEDGTRVAITPVYDPDAEGDGTDGAVIFEGSEQGDVPVGLNHYQFFASTGSARYSTSRIPFQVNPNA